ncbi:MAG: HAD family phosphatase [Euryarchaeota archaeon]|nr:HAD family phosphatase [Euryarchaeota archaeon]
MDKFKLVLFDMDGTLLKDKGIFVIAEKKGFIEELIRLFKDDSREFYKRSIDIAKLQKGFSKKDFLDIFRTVPLQDHAKEVINELKNKKIKTAIVTDSYQFLADDLKERLGIDYAFANDLVTNGDTITGELVMQNKDLVGEFYTGKIYSICKSRVLEQLCKELGITEKEVIAVGDGKIDIGMIKRAGLGIAINALEEVQKNADVITNDLKVILEYV